MIFEVIGKPQGKQRARVCVRNGFANAYTPEETASYENLIKLCYQRAVAKDTVNTLYDKSLHVEIIAYYEIPKSFSRKRRGEALSGALKPLVKPDIDNIVKIVCDALNKVAYRDDTQIVRITAEKRYSETPRVLIKITEN